MSKELKLLSESEIPQKQTSDFKKFIDKKREKMAGEMGYHYNRRKYYSLDLIAKSLGITKEMLQKRINKQKPTDKRDFVIALCAVLGCNSDETNIAMRLYDHMPALDIDNGRDDCIIDFLENHEGQISSLADIDSFLVARNYPKLNVIDHRAKNKNKSATEPHRPYPVVKKTIQTYYDEGDQYDSLETAYNFRNRCAVVYMLKKSEETNVILRAWSDGTLIVDSPTSSPVPTVFNHLEDTREYQGYFAEMLHLAEQEQRKIDAYLNDTRNYPFRFGAELKDDSIHIYYEQYNYTFPDRNEYYLMEYIDKHFRLSVSTQSMFMQEYLSPDEYSKHFRSNSRGKRIVYDSISEIENAQLNARLPHYKESVLRARKSAYKQLQCQVADILNQIRERKIFIRNHDMIWYAESDEVCRYYHVEKEFECTLDKEICEIFAGKEQAELIDTDGNTFIISIQELRRAFELGFTDVAQICRVKRNLGNIEFILE